MSALIWILTWLSLVPPAVSELPKPTNVTLICTGSGYILSWEPGPGTPSETSYSVSTQTDRSSQIPVNSCQQVQNPRTCNLTEALKEPWEKYDIRVIAELGVQRSQSAEVQYKAIDHLDLPELTVVPCQRNLCVDFQPQKRHPRWIYDGLGYELQISSARDGGAQIIKDFRSLETQVVTDLLPGREYCVSFRFSDSLENKISNFSQPVCVSTPAVFSADLIILFTLIFLVFLVLVVVVLLVWTGFICQKQRPLPPILTSIQQLEEVLVRASPTSLMSIKLVAPPAGAKRNSQSSSEDSDEDCGTSCRSSSGGGGGYTERVGTNLHSSSSSSLSSSSSSSLSSKQKAEMGSCSRTTDRSNLQPQTLTETRPRTEPNTPSSEGLTRGRTEQQEEVGGSADREVNLFSLTFGRQEEEEEEDSVSPSEECSVPLVPPVLLSQPAASSRTVGDEETTDETCGYMFRPSAKVLQNLLSNT